MHMIGPHVLVIDRPWRSSFATHRKCFHAALGFLTTPPPPPPSAYCTQAVVERCAHKLPPIHTLITLGGQHQGVANTPGCSTDLTGVAATACSAMQVLLARGAYAPWVRENLVQAQYFKVRVPHGTMTSTHTLALFVPNKHNMITTVVRKKNGNGFLGRSEGRPSHQEVLGPTVCSKSTPWMPLHPSRC